MVVSRQDEAMNDSLTRCDGSKVFLPMHDPVVAGHVESASSNVSTLLSEISDRDIYRPLFEGKKDLTFLDIGANIGLVSIYAVPACRRILSVEPDPTNYNVLRAATYPWANVIETVQAALAPKDGNCEFFQNDMNSTASSSVNTYGKKIDVPGLTLSSILRIHQLEKVDVVKVDCEGAEELSLNAGELQQASGVIDALWIETHNTPTSRWEDTIQRLAATLDYLGYTKQSIVGMRLMASK